MRTPTFLAVLALVLLCPDPGLGQEGEGDAVLLGPGDMVRLEAFLDADYPRVQARPVGSMADTVLVDDRGMVLLPVAGLVRVAGRPFSEVRREVEEAFRAEFTDARVRLIPLLRVAVLGEVRAPGLLPVDPTMRLADVVAAAGGLTESADRGDVRLVRGETVLLVGSEADLPGIGPPLRTGDRIVVGHRSWAAENLPFLIGAGASVVAALVTSLLVR